MTYDLSRFIKAQNKDYNKALIEIKNGKKKTHWIWYIFPQYKGLGYSDISKYYSFESIEEAKEYYNNEYLRNNLIEITSTLLSLPSNDPIEILGDIDSLKVKSCMTLFSYITDNPIFKNVLTKFYNDSIDEKTIRLIKEDIINK